MNSFALWYEKKSENANCCEDSKLSIHVNLWNRMAKHNMKNYCFDFGFLIGDITNIKKIFLFVPFKIKIDNITDLGRIILNHCNLVHAIFNGNYSVLSDEAKKLLVMEKDSTFIIYALSKIEKQIDVYDYDNGSIIELNLCNIPTMKDKSNKYYFRFRIEVCNKNVNLIDDQIKGISIFSDQFTNTEIIDFRINDIRSCTDEIREKFNSGTKFIITEIHYLIIRDADDVIIYNGNDISSRVLETNIWCDYIEGLSHNMVAYHFKKLADNCSNEDVKSIDKFSILARFQYKKNTRLLLIVYITVVIILGAIGGVLGDFVSRIIGI